MHYSITENSSKLAPVRGMIMAAGLGTRFKPWTDQHPKALAIVNGKSLLQRNIEYLQQHDIREVVVNVHHFADQIVQAIHQNNGWGSNIIISDETDTVLETGGGLKKAAIHLQDGSFVVLNVDILTDLNLGEMIHYHQQLMPLATLGVTNRSTSRYFLFDQFHNLCGWRNIKTGEERISRVSADNTPKAFSGIHVIDPKIFSLTQQQGKFSIVDVYLELAKSWIIKGFDHTGSKFIDVGKPEAVAVADSLFP